MNNADLPAMPQSISQTLDSGYISSSDFVGGMGLTKREYFAGLAMQAMISNSNWYTTNGIADDAVEAADRLLDALEKKS